MINFCLISTTVLNSKIGHREHIAGLLLDLARQPVGGDGHRHPRLIAGDPTATQTLSDGGRCAAAAEEISNDVALIGRDPNDALDDGLGLLGGIPDALIGLGVERSELVLTDKRPDIVQRRATVYVLALAIVLIVATSILVNLVVAIGVQRREPLLVEHEVIMPAVAEDHVMLPAQVPPGATADVVVPDDLVAELGDAE